MTLPKWSVVMEGPQAVLYDPTLEMFKERRAELIELLQNGPPGPCDVAQDSSWLMLRGSGTEPILRIYAEAKTNADAQKLLRLGVKLAAAIA